MKVFDVYLNGRKLCRAGVGPDGVLTAMVTWTKLTGTPARQARQSKRPVEETRLQVGGLRKRNHREWIDRALRPGDQVSIVVRRTGRVDPPALTKPAGPPRVGADFTSTTFLNVDLDIWSARPLDALVAAFGRRVIVLHCGKDGRRYVAHLELAHSGGSEGADRLIREFVTLVRKLSPRSRTLWNRAQRRDFSVGIQAASTPHSYELPIESRTLRAASSVNARVVVTVYAAGWTDPQASSRRA